MQECLIVNEINRLHHLDNKLQYDFLLNSLRTWIDMLDEGEEV